MSTGVRPGELVALRWRDLDFETGRAIHRAGLPSLRIKDLRHVHAWIRLGEGVHPQVVQEQPGHASVRLTLDTYSHVTPSIHSEAVQRVGNVLEATGQPKQVA